MAGIDLKGEVGGHLAGHITAKCRLMGSESDLADFRFGSIA